MDDAGEGHPQGRRTRVSLGTVPGTVIARVLDPCKHRHVSEDPDRTKIGYGRRFLLAVIDGGGTVPPALGVAADLVRRGHQVRVLADQTVELAALSAGCAFSPWQEAPHFASRVEQTAMIAAVDAGLAQTSGTPGARDDESPPATGRMHTRLGDVSGPIAA